MSADILTSASFPHGTPDGFRNGCHGSHCPAPIACRDVHRRYAGDYTFRTQVDAGMTLTQILDAEQTAREAVITARREAIREAARIRHNTNRRRARDGRTTAQKRSPDGTPRTPQQIEIHRLHALGYTDTQIGHAMGKNRHQVTGIRAYLRLAPNKAPVETTGASL